MAGLFTKVKKFVEESFRKCGFKEQIKHLERTVYWVKKLKPNADEALLIAAFAHDIETAFAWKKLQKNYKPKFIAKSRLKKHQKEGAEIIGEFLKNQGANSEMVKRVKMLISKHEEGGNEDQTLLKDADSVSFFENNIDVFLKIAKKSGKERVKQKFDWMYNRITSKKVKDIAKPWYRKAINDLNKLNKNKMKNEK
jgi:hypothetical protein